MLCKAVSKLTHVQQRNLLAFQSTIHTESKIAQFAIGHTDKRVTCSTDTSSFGHLHCQIFQLWQTRILAALWLEDILAPETNDGEFCGFALSTTIHIERHFCLHARNRCAGTDYLMGEFRHVFASIGKNGHSVATEKLSGTCRMKVYLSFLQFFITI